MGWVKANFNKWMKGLKNDAREIINHLPQADWYPISLPAADDSGRYSLPTLPLYYFAIPVLLLSMTIRGIEYTLGQFGCAVLLFSLPKFLSTPSLLSKGPDHEKRWSLDAVQVVLSNGQHSCSSHRIQNTAANGLMWRKLLYPIQTLYMNSKGIGKAFRPGEDKKDIPPPVQATQSVSSFKW